QLLFLRRVLPGRVSSNGVRVGATRAPRPIVRLLILADIFRREKDRRRRVEAAANAASPVKRPLPARNWRTRKGVTSRKLLGTAHCRGHGAGDAPLSCDLARRE